MAKHSITAVFDTRSHAEQAAAELKSSGVPASDVTLLPADGEAADSIDATAGSAATGGKGFWGSLEQLFGGTEDHATYAESIRRGGIMLTVRADDDRLDGIVDILERHGSVDLDERERSWRSEGWTGGPALSGTGATTSSSAAAAGSRGLGMDDPGMTAMGDAPQARMGTLGGTLGAGALGAGAGALGTAADEERRTAATPAPSVVDPVPEPVIERAMPVTDRTVTDRAAVSTAAAGATARGLGAADETLKVYEERLDVGKRAVSRGKVRVRTSVVSREVNEDVTLHGETVTVDRRPVDRPVSAAALDADPFRERTIELEEFAEEAVVAKSAHVVEEIGIRKEGTDRVETVHETLRSTKVDVDDDRAGRAVAGTAAGVAAGAVAGAAGRFASEIRDGLKVVGSDGAHVGTVDHLDGGRIKLKKDDPASGGEHHWLTQEMVSSVSDKVTLAVTAAEARARWAAA